MNKNSVDATGASLHPLDAQFKGLGLDRLDPVDKMTSEFEVLKKLLQNTKVRLCSRVLGMDH